MPLDLVNLNIWKTHCSKGQLRQSISCNKMQPLHYARFFNIIPFHLRPANISMVASASDYDSVRQHTTMPYYLLRQTPLWPKEAGSTLPKMAANLSQIKEEFIVCSVIFLSKRSQEQNHWHNIVHFRINWLGLLNQIIFWYLILIMFHYNLKSFCSHQENTSNNIWRWWVF